MCLTIAILSPSYCIKHSMSHTISCLKMPCDSYTLKWMFMYDTQLKNREKTLAYKSSGFSSFRLVLFWKGTSKHMNANNLQRCHKCMLTAWSISSICYDLVGVCYAFLAYGLLNCAVGLNAYSEGWGEESMFLLLDWWNDFSRLSDNLSDFTVHTTVLLFYIRIHVSPTSAVVTGITETTVTVVCDRIFKNN